MKLRATERKQKLSFNGQEYGDSDNFEYVVDSNIAEQLSFSASDLSSLIDTSNGSTSISYFNDLVSISAGTYTGNSQ